MTNAAPEDRDVAWSLFGQDWIAAGNTQDEVLSGDLDDTIAIRTLVQYRQAAELREAERTEKHRNDLVDRIVAQSAELGALRAELADAKAGLVDALGVIEKISLQIKPDDFGKDDYENLDFEGGYGFLIDTARAFMDKLEA